MLRGFAAAGVMLHHHGQYYDVLYPGRIPLSFDLGHGHFGVELFFIISGFVILMTIERKQTVREFAISRAGRLMPAFLAALLIATLIRIVSPVPVLDTPTVPQFLANLTMAPSLFGQTPMDMPYWTLTYELVFYIGMGLILALGMLRWAEWFGLLAVAVGCLVIVTLEVRLYHRTSIVLLVYYSNFFLIGICLYRMHAHTARPVTWAALVVAIAVTALGGGERSFDTPGRIYLPLTIAFTALVWFAISRHGRWLAWRPLVLLGVISYPLYLVHVVLGFAIIRWGVAHSWTTIEGVVAAGVVSIITATLLHYFVELRAIASQELRWGATGGAALTRHLFRGGRHRRLQQRSGTLKARTVVAKVTRSQTGHFRWRSGKRATAEVVREAEPIEGEGSKVGIETGQVIMATYTSS